MILAPYHPDIPEMRRLTPSTGERSKTWTGPSGKPFSLKDDGLYGDTIIVYNSDHGGVIARSKRFLYSSGNPLSLDRPYP